MRPRLVSIVSICPPLYVLLSIQLNVYMPWCPSVHFHVDQPPPSPPSRSCRGCAEEYLESFGSGAGGKEEGDDGAGPALCPHLGCGRPLTLDLTAAARAGESGAAGPSRGGGGGAGPSGSRDVLTPPAPRPPKRAARGILSRIDKTRFRSSSKIEALREDIAAARADDPGAKCLVFSQFASLLDLVGHRLETTGIRCARLSGGTTLRGREAVLRAFTHDPDVTCLLVSLRAGGVALNLTAASHVFLLDPWWNPAVEHQARDRIHRLGQNRPVTIHRFVVRGSIEERILKLQQKKELVFESTVGSDPGALAKLTPEDLAFLFG